MTPINPIPSPSTPKQFQGWVGVDLDGTLAQYDHWRGPLHIGEPIPTMLNRVKRWLAVGMTVKIFTARVGPVDLDKVGAEYPTIVENAIHTWCEKHLGQKLEVTATKDFQMVELWDDRAVQIIPNTGARADGREPLLLDTIKIYAAAEAIATTIHKCTTPPENRTNLPVDIENFESGHKQMLLDCARAALSV